MAEARNFPNPNEITALKAKPLPQQGNTGRWGQTSQDKTWKYLCLAVFLILLLMLIILCVVLSKVLKKTKQVQWEVIQLNEKVTQGLGDARHDLDFIRGEMFRQMKAVLAGNESSCEPCPLDWKFFQGSCYFFSLDNLTWTQANDSCAQRQAHLVIINSQAEQVHIPHTVCSFDLKNILGDGDSILSIVQMEKLSTKGWIVYLWPYNMHIDFLTSTEQVTSWIGLFKEGKKGNHRWTDGSTPTYTNWESKELRDNGTSPACMMIHKYGYWRNFSCESDRFAFICERRQDC